MVPPDCETGYDDSEISGFAAQVLKTVRDKETMMGLVRNRRTMIMRQIREKVEDLEDVRKIRPGNKKSFQSSNLQDEKPAIKKMYFGHLDQYLYYLNKEQ